MSALKDLTGKKFGRLTVLNLDSKRKRLLYWKCLCECGNIRIVFGGALTRGATKSCGCLLREVMIKNKTIHGMTKTPEHNCWCDMKKRCLNPNSTNYKNWGGRGIKVCAYFLESFENFFTDLGYKPSPKHSLDRIDNDLNYSCGHCKECIENGWKTNVRWGTEEQQVHNKRNNKWYEFNGEKLILADWAKKFKTTTQVLWSFLNYGDNTIEDAVRHYLK